MGKLAIFASLGIVGLVAILTWAGRFLLRRSRPALADLTAPGAGVAASLTNRAMPNLSTGRRLVNIKCHSPSDGLTLTWSHVSTVTRARFHRLPHSLAKNFTKSRFPPR